MLETSLLRKDRVCFRLKVKGKFSLIHFSSYPIIIAFLEIFKLALTVCRFSMGGFLAQMLMLRNKLLATTKLSSEHKTRPIANVFVAAFYILIISLNSFS